MLLTARRHSFARRLLGLALGAALAGPAQAWDWSTAAPLPQDVSAPAAFGVPDAQGLWQLGRGLVHYAADGHADIVRDANVADSALSVALPGGGVLFTNGLHDDFSGFSAGPPSQCILRAYSGQGAPRWQDTADDGGFCQRVGLDSAGVLWVKTNNTVGPVLRYALDGAELAPVAGAFADFALRGDGVYALGGSTPARIVALDHNAATQWTWTDTDATHTYRRIARGDDGNVYAAGFVGNAATPGGTLQIASVDAGGNARWSIQVPVVQASGIAALAPSGDGALYVLAVNGPGSAAGIQLVRVGNEGTLAWNHALDGAQNCNAYDAAGCSFAVAPNGDALIAASIGSGNERVYRYDGTGTQHYAQDVSGAVTAQRALANGNALIALRQAAPVALSALELAPDGTTATPPAAAAIDAYPQAGHGNVAADGSSYLLTRVADATTLTRIDADGSVVWQHGVAGGERSSAFGNTVCVVSDQTLGCYAVADGTPLWNTTLDSSNGSTPVRVLADGSVEVIEQHPAGPVTQHVFNGDGSERQHRDLVPGSVGAQIAANGTVYLFDSSFKNLYAYDSSGNPVFDAAVPQALTPVFGSQQPTLTLGSDGSAVVTLNKEDPNNSTPAAWLVSAQGATVWQVVLQDAQPAFPNGVYVQIAARIGFDGTVYFALSNLVPNATTLNYTVNVTAIAPTGQRLWLAPQVLQTPGSVALVQDVATRNVLVLGQAPDRLTRAALDSVSGNVVGFTLEACPAEAPPAGARFAGDSCTWQDFGLTPDGTLHATAMVQSETARSGPVAFARGNAAARFGALTLLPAGFDGAWYAPYEPGQGFLFDEVNGVQILSWFTFAPGADNANDPSHLAWYTAQASCCAPGQTFYSSGIYQSNPGTFGSDTVPAQQVGTLRVYYTDCNDALLTYAFTPGPSGSIALKRLTPSTTGCGNGAPPQIASAPTNGFDTSQSGSWFDPQESGQGFDFVVLPGGGGFGGLVYGAWFTFDPAGAANDAGHLQWFTLQGDLSQASGGSVQMPILETLGGSFDGAPTANTNVVGQATLTFSACDHASLSYNFDHSPQAHAFAGLSGVTNLVKIGGCPNR